MRRRAMTTEPKPPVRHRSRPIPGEGPNSTANAAIQTATVVAEKQSPDYGVGYKKPPKATQFPPGRSGNPKGRSKGTRNLKTDLTEELQERILLKEGGRPKQVSKQRAMLKSLMAKALQGDPRAATLIVSLVARLLDQTENDVPPPPPAAEDLAIIEAFEARIRRSIQS